MSDIETPQTNSLRHATSADELIRPTVERYFSEDSASNLVLLDPINGDILRPDRIPESLAADGELKRGYDFLFQHADRIRFTLLLAEHLGSDGLDKAGIDMAAVAIMLSKTGGALYLEGARTKVAKSAQQEDETRQFKDAVARQLASVKQYLPEIYMPEVDYSDQSSRPADQALVRWQHDIETEQEFVSRTILESPEESLRAYDNLIAMFVGFEAYRQWYLVGKIGATLADIDAQRQPPSNDCLEAAGLFGSMHPGLGKRLEFIGAEVVYRGERREDLPEDDAAIALMIADISVPFEERVRRQAKVLRNLEVLKELGQKL
jgi:hypothetical protein